MDLRQLKSIIKEFEDSTIHKLEITEKDFTVKMEKKGNDPISPVSYQSTNLFPNSEQPLVAHDPIQTVENDYTSVIAPLVGTYYESPSPDSEPFVVLNQSVKKGDILFIVEAMKVMNEITSPVSGIIKKINVTNATMVEYGQVVMEIEE
ncbi:MAG: acetyl-CoA carboxylase biotin carboxyl carrier protein [Bacilli bacterium]|nr:acetyl-CoA carboxylase biotin carboxyl carrier protein [Bacilli bacterium]MBN2877233.1 acetyl-CoA carboxylase biotin carboxyl carrier protein [Bacilli bacterium]